MKKHRIIRITRHHGKRTPDPQITEIVDGVIVFQEIAALEHKSRLTELQRRIDTYNYDTLHASLETGDITLVLWE